MTKRAAAAAETCDSKGLKESKTEQSSKNAENEDAVLDPTHPPSSEKLGAYVKFHN